MPVAAQTVADAPGLDDLPADAELGDVLDAQDADAARAELAAAPALDLEAEPEAEDADDVGDDAA